MPVIQDMSVETDTLYRTLYERITKKRFTWGSPSPSLGGRSGDRGSNVVPHEMPLYCALCLLNVTVSLSVDELDALQMFELGDPTPKLGNGWS